MSVLNPSTPAFEPQAAFGTPKPTENLIKNVWSYNLKEEIIKICFLLESYNYIAMDTEFPGIIFRVQGDIREPTYQNIRENVNVLKLIQVGFTISDEQGNRPAGVCTWQFNVKFDLEIDTHSDDSINLLKDSGIDFEALKRDGIEPEELAEYFMISGLVLNEEVTYVTFHSGYDFAYLLKILTSEELPESEEEFYELMSVYFPEFYDIKYVVRGVEKFRGGLNRIAEVTRVNRVGKTHEAGSDSLVTLETFFKIREDLFSAGGLENHKNVICGMGGDLLSSVYKPSEEFLRGEPGSGSGGYHFRG